MKWKMEFEKEKKWNKSHDIAVLGNLQLDRFKAVNTDKQLQYKKSPFFPFYFAVFYFIVDSIEQLFNNFFAIIQNSNYLAHKHYIVIY